MPDLCLICNTPNPDLRLGGVCLSCDRVISERVARTTARLLSGDSGLCEPAGARS